MYNIEVKKNPHQCMKRKGERGEGILGGVGKKRCFYCCSIYVIPNVPSNMSSILAPKVYPHTNFFAT